MFTGIIQQVGEVVGLKAGRFTIRVERWPTPFERGESIAVNGACLTLTDWSKNQLHFDLLAETLKRTNLARAKRVNLERSLRLGDAVGGHFVTGHVDGTSEVHSLKKSGRDWILEIACSKSIRRGIVNKGSIAVDGVSLTVVDVKPNRFTVHLIPHTWKHTALSDLQAGDCVNLETDMLGKYAQRRANR